MTEPTTAIPLDPQQRERDLLRRSTFALHVAFVVATIVAVVVVGTVLHTAVLAFAIGAAVFGAWAVTRWRAEDALRQQALAGRPNRQQMRTSWADVDRPSGPRLAVSPPTGSSGAVVSGPPVAGPPTNRIVAPTDPT